MYKSIWAGVKINSLSLNELQTLFNGGIVTRLINNRFFRSLSNLSIAIKDYHVTVDFMPHKELANNKRIEINSN